MKQTTSMTDLLASYIKQYQEAGYPESFIEGFAETFPKGFVEGKAKQKLEDAKKLIPILENLSLSKEDILSLVKSLGFSTEQAQKLVDEAG